VEFQQSAARIFVRLGAVLYRPQIPDVMLIRPTGSPLVSDDSSEPRLDVPDSDQQLWLDVGL
jgi:hypothetical protein